MSFWGVTVTFTGEGQVLNKQCRNKYETIFLRRVGHYNAKCGNPWSHDTASTEH